MTGLWRYGNKAPEGKYLVLRRDGSIPEWPNIVLGARDAAASAGLRAYAEKARELGYDPVYVEDVLRLADEFEQYSQEYGPSQPDSDPDLEDKPEIVELLKLTRAT